MVHDRQLTENQVRLVTPAEREGAAAFDFTASARSDRAFLDPIPESSSPIDSCFSHASNWTGVPVRWSAKDLRHRCRQQAESGFDPRSEVYQAIDKAYCAVHGLRVTLHYISCERGG